MPGLHFFWSLFPATRKKHAFIERRDIKLQVVQVHRREPLIAQKVRASTGEKQPQGKRTGCIYVCAGRQQVPHTHKTIFHTTVALVKNSCFAEKFQVQHNVDEFIYIYVYMSAVPSLPSLYCLKAWPISIVPTRQTSDVHPLPHNIQTQVASGVSASTSSWTKNLPPRSQWRGR